MVPPEVEAISGDTISITGLLWKTNVTYEGSSEPCTRSWTCTGAARPYAGVRQSTFDADSCCASTVANESNLHQIEAVFILPWLGGERL